MTQSSTSLYPHTINGLQLERLDLRADQTAFHYKENGTWLAVTAREAHARTERLALALRTLGVGRATSVGILAGTRPEWLTADGAILGLGAVTVGLYPSSTAEQVAYILAHSETEVVIVENEAQRKKVLEALERLPKLRHLIQVDGVPPPQPGLQTWSWSQLQALGGQEAAQNPGLYRRLCLEVQPDDIATLVYTSGTTGPPKGAILTHRNFFEVVSSVQQVFRTRDDEVGLIFLPLAHVLQRFTVYQGVKFGGTGYFAESIEKVPENLEEVRPTIFATVPRVLEKIHTRVLSTVESGSPLRRKIFAAAMQVGRRFHTHPDDRPRPLLLRWQYGLADRLVFSKVRARLGGRVDRVVSGGAPLSPHISEFFQAMGILVIEGYGLTETTAPCTTNTPDCFRFGTVGQILPGTAIRIADDGELLVRGPGVFQGYLKDPAATAQAIRDGWFYTGDIGIIDPEGFVKITDRKKDIIITSSGKNIAPQELENRLKAHPLISNVMLHGDRRKFLSALITLDEEEARLALGSPIPPGPHAHNPQIQKTIEDVVSTYNARVAPYESIKRYAILERDFTIEGGELTPTLKVKRRVIAERYKALLDSFYTE